MFKRYLKIINILGMILIFIGLGFLIFLERKLLKLPNVDLSNITTSSKHLPSPSIPKTIFNPGLAFTSSSSPVQTQLPSPKPMSVDQLRLALQNNVKSLFNSISYSQIQQSIDQATNATDPSLAYQDYKKTYDLINQAYAQTSDQRMKYVMIEIRVYSRNLPNFKDSDMPVPS